MRSRVLVGIGAGLVTAVVVLGIGVVAFDAGRRDDGITRTVTDEDGEVVRVVELDGLRGRGPGPALLLVPLGLLAVGALAFGLGRRSGAHWGPGHGCGPRPWPGGEHHLAGESPPTPGAGDDAPA